MKKLTLSLLFSFFCLLSFAQTKPTAETNFRAPGGYQIRIIPAAETGFGFEIYLNGKRLIQQLKNPVSNSKEGLSREDALKAARYRASQLAAGADPRVIEHMPISQQTAQQLQLNIKQ